MICVCIGRGRHKHMMAEHSHLVEQGAKLVELRLDYITGEVNLKRLLDNRPGPVLISCRRPADGGKWSGTEDERLVLSTIHSAKGLEWHSVFIIHLVDGYFPAVQSLENEEDLEEERRLFYVAATRAQKNLYLITPELEARSYRWHTFDPSGLIFSEPSRFIAELPDFDELTEIGVLEFEEEDIKPF